MASKRGNLWTHYTFVFTKLHRATAFCREAFSHHTTEHRSNYCAVYILFKHHYYVTVLTSMTKNTKKKGSDLIVFKTLRRQTAIQEGKQQANKQTQKDPSSKTERHSGHSAGNCVRQKVLVTTILLLDIEAISDSWILSLFHTNNWSLSELNTPWNVLIVLWEMSDTGKNICYSCGLISYHRERALREKSYLNSSH